MKIGEYDNGTPLAVKIDTLVETRLLIQASSGGGKSNAIRLIAEAAAGHVQTIIIDREGELHTLAAKADMLVVGEEGAIAPNPRNAGALAIELLRSGVSCVVDLLGIAPAQQKTYVRAFVENMNAAPRELWHPVLVVIDEAHVFCPEKGHGEAECSEAIEILMSAGRKRGYCGILATQRVSILSKTAAAEATNKLIGRANLDLDYKRAGDEMGMPRKDAPLLARLKTGQFHVLGPAFGATSEYRLAQLQKAETKPPPRGSRGAVAAPSKSILAKLPALEAIGKETNPDDVHTIEKARERIKALKTELATEKRKPAPAAPPPAPVDVAAIERRVRDGMKKAFAPILRDLQKTAARIAEDQESLARGLGSFAAIVEAPQAGENHAASNAQKLSQVQSAAVNNGHHAEGGGHQVRRELRRQTLAVPAVRGEGEELPTGEAAVLRALIQYPHGLRREQLTVLTGYKRSSRDAYISRLKQRGFASENGLIFATTSGHAAMPDAQPLPTGRALQEFWLARLPEGERKILEVLISAYDGEAGSGMPRDTLGENTGYKRSSRDAYLSRLASKELIVSDREGVRASETLFEGAE